jgi:hypothetical protein
MSYDAALTFFAHQTRGDDAGDVIRILCAMASVADLVGDMAERDRTIEVASDLSSDSRLTRRRRPD